MSSITITRQQILSLIKKAILKGEETFELEMYKLLHSIEDKE